MVAVLESLAAVDAPARLAARAADIAGRGEAWLLSAATGVSSASAPAYLGDAAGHEYAGRAFQAAVTPTALERWGAVERPPEA
jgi:hypothetical protein